MQSTEPFKKILSIDYSYKPVLMYTFTKTGVEKQNYWKRADIIYSQAYQHVTINQGERK